MKIKLLIASADGDYTAHLSNVLSEKYAAAFEVAVCTSIERLRDLFSANRYGAALMEPDFAPYADLDAIALPLLLAEETDGFAGAAADMKKIPKYQRISSMVGAILEIYAEAGCAADDLSAKAANVTAVWSPCGGSGKTSAALAYAAYKISGGKRATYLSFENFSSVPAYFQENTKSISKVFEKLDSNLNMILTGIRATDGASGIAYFGAPENYEDMNILSASDIKTIIDACAAETDELVIDLSSQCDGRARAVFEAAETIFLVCDHSRTSQAKLRQFIAQHDVFGQIQQKCVLINNKGANISDTGIGKTVQLPFVQSAADPVSVFKTLANGKFEW